jgi:hypothetical protein
MEGNNKNDILKKNIFIYCVIFVLIMAIFKRLTIGLNIIFGYFIVYMIISLLDHKQEKQIKENKEIEELKTSIIQPKPLLLQNYKDIINFLFSIQDYYKYNPAVYENIIDNLDNFFHLYEETYKLNELAGTNYKLMNNIKLDTINVLHSLIYKLPEDIAYIHKLNNSFEILNKILSKYLFDIYKINKNTILNKGYNINTIIINHNEPIPFTTYDKIYGKNYDFF